jgi:uncharacterized protein (TIGR03790 family)
MIQEKTIQEKTALLLAVATILFLLMDAVPSATAQAAIPLSGRVLVVVNAGNSSSKRVAEHYMTARSVPAANKCGVKPLNDDVMDWEEYDTDLKKAIRKCLTRVGPEKILYIVLSYKLPFKLENVPAGHGTAVDQYISDIWDQELAAGPRPINPYYAEIQSKPGVYPPFIPLAAYRDAPRSHLVYSVWRLDGPTRDIADALVEKAIAAEKAGPTGQACFDRRYGDDLTAQPETGYNRGDWDLLRAAQFARAAGFTVIEDTHSEEFGTPPAPARCDHAILYSGWYSLGNYNDAFTWNTGAIGFHLDSLSAAHPREGKNWSANALKRGITVTSGAVDEPYLPGLPRPVGVFRALFQGANVGDAFLRNTLWTRWMIINIGDPLYRPFPNGRGEFTPAN